MVAGRKWQFTARFRAKAYGWRGSSLAISRLKEAVSEIKAVAKSDPVAAGGGAVSLMERIWPAFQDIDTSSGALGMAVARTLAELIPVLIDAPADHATRSAGWLMVPAVPAARCSPASRQGRIIALRRWCSPHLSATPT
jgi:hypothetical protein